MVSGRGICTKCIVVDARHHMLARLASIIAKELLNSQKVVVVRCEEICISGGLVRRKMKHMRFLRKRMTRMIGYSLHIAKIIHRHPKTSNSSDLIILLEREFKSRSCNSIEVKA